MINKSPSKKDTGGLYLLTMEEDNFQCEKCKNLFHDVCYEDEFSEVPQFNEILCKDCEFYTEERENELLEKITILFNRLTFKKEQILYKKYYVEITELICQNMISSKIDNDDRLNIINEFIKENWGYYRFKLKIFILLYKKFIKYMNLFFKYTVFFIRDNEFQNFYENIGKIIQFKLYFNSKLNINNFLEEDFSNYFLKDLNLHCVVYDIKNFGKYFIKNFSFEFTFEQISIFSKFLFGNINSCLNFFLILNSTNHQIPENKINFLFPNISLEYSFFT